MAHLIDKDALVAEIDRILGSLTDAAFDSMIGKNLIEIKDFIDTLEVKEVDLYNNGWIDCGKQMPKETKQTSDTLQGHHEWTESDLVLVWDSHYGAGIDSTRNGKWRSEQKGGYTGQICHDIIAWRPIPNFSEELLLKARCGH